MQTKTAIRVGTILVVLAAAFFAPVQAGDCGKCDSAVVIMGKDQKVPQIPADVKKLPPERVRLSLATGSPQPPPNHLSTPYETFSFFLIPDNGWETTNRAELVKLKSAFQEFGDKIGGQHLAIWFAPSVGDIHGVDIGTNQQYCDKFSSHLFKLLYDRGPYVITIQKHPEDWKPGDQVLVVQLNGIEAARVMGVLKVLVEDLHSGSITNPHTQAIDLERLLQVFLSAKDKKGLGGIAIALVYPPTH